MTVEKEVRMEVANTIARQLGGTGRLKAMLGAKDFVALSDKCGGLMFGYKGGHKANKIKIVLNGMDLYDVEVLKISKKAYDVKVKTVANIDNIYVEDLKGWLEEKTGMYFSL